jgi:adenosylmethionine-8-amino-7-oxononanoate aminotransferase
VSVPEGVDIVATRDVLLAEGVIVRPIPANHMSMCPPLVITDSQIDRMVEAIGSVLRG